MENPLCALCVSVRFDELIAFLENNPNPGDLGPLQSFYLNCSFYEKLQILRVVQSFVFDISGKVFEIMTKGPDFCGIRERTMLCDVLCRVEAGRDQKFLVADVGFRVLQMMEEGVNPADSASELLEDIISVHHGFLTWAPNVTFFLGVIVEEYEANEFRFIGELIRRAGTSFVIQLARGLKNEHASRFLKTYISKTSEWNGEDEMTDILVSLWPEYICKVLDKPLPQKNGRLVDCPILLEQTEDGVFASDGYSYDRNSIMQHAVKDQRSPMTRNRLSTMFIAGS